MTTTHEDIQWVAGDDCQINATLLKADGTPFDLSGTQEIKWTLMDSGYRRIINTEDVIISVVDAIVGKCSIVIPAAITSPLPAGRYTDVIRIIIGGITSTLSFGAVLVQADPWYVPTAAAAANTSPPRVRLAATR